jgi:hypothetical protein
MSRFLRFVSYLSTILLVAGLAGSCHSQTGPSCDVCVKSAVVYGLVTKADGTPINGARLHEGVYNSCAAQDSTDLAGEGSDIVRTGADGSYRDVVRGMSAAGSYCIAVKVDSLPGLGLSTATTPGIMTLFSGPFGAPTDSVRIDVVMH